MGTIVSMIGGVILAAGKGSRIGLPKALLTTGRGGQVFVARAFETLRLASVSPVVVVVSGEIADRVQELVPGATIRVNPHPDRGQLSSLQIALDTLAGEFLEAIVVLPVDVPLVTPETVASLIDVWRRLRLPIVRPTRGPEHGHPVVFDARVFDDLRGADPAIGAKAVVREHACVEGDVVIEDAGAFLDVDTIDDYQRAFGDQAIRPGE